MKVLWLILFLFCGTISANEWWKSASLYQIYPRSFKDSNGNGVGDIKGITNNLEYIKELGIDCVWLSPVLKSPQADFGYDIADFRDIDPLFGTMEDFNNMLAKAKKLDIKILLDFVPNHTSDEHEWFVKSENNDEGYKDYYMWVDGKDCKDEPWNEEDGVPCNYPNNWVSVFYGHAWTWSWKRKQFYLHQFDKKQPDLNYRNPKVKKEMQDVLTFWLKKGVDGFRIDAINFLYEIEDLRDEPRNPNENDPEAWDYVFHHYTLDQDDTYEEVYEWRKLIDDFNRDNGGDPRILVTETYANISSVMKYYQSEDGTRRGSHFPFNFWLLTDIHRESSAHDFKRLIMQWMDNMPSDATANWVIGNHDQKRFGTRLGTERIIGMHSIVLTLPGVSVTYYGDEIGMYDHQDITWEETVDPQACNGPKEDYKDRSRDPCRTPFQWNSSTNAGFSDEPDAEKPWLPVHPDYQKVNLKNQLNDEMSTYNYFRALIELRKEPAFAQGSFKVDALSDNILAYLRSKDDKTYAVIANVGKDNEKLTDLGKLWDNLPQELEVVMPGGKSGYKKGSKVSSAEINVWGYDTVVFMYKSSAIKLVATMSLLCMSFIMRAVLW